MSLLKLPSDNFIIAVQRVHQMDTTSVWVMRILDFNFVLYVLMLGRPTGGNCTTFTDIRIPHRCTMCAMDAWDIYLENSGKIFFSHSLLISSSFFVLIAIENTYFFLVFCAYSNSKPLFLPRFFCLW